MTLQHNTFVTTSVHLPDIVECWLLLLPATYQSPDIQFIHSNSEQEVKVIWQKAPHGGPIPRLGVTPGGRKLYHWIPGVGFPISVP